MYSIRVSSAENPNAYVTASIHAVSLGYQNDCYSLLNALHEFKY